MVKKKTLRDAKKAVGTYASVTPPANALARAGAKYKFGPVQVEDWYPVKKGKK